MEKKNKPAIILISSILLVIIAAVVFVSVIMPSQKYKTALAQVEAGNYYEAYTIFESLGEYKDSLERLNQLSQQYGADFCVQQIKARGDMAALSKVTFGDYTWLVVNVEKNRALLMTNDIAGERAYNDDATSITWEESTMRSYLNGEFYQQFSPADKAKILETALTNPDNERYGTAGGNDTKDYVFLLSVDEVNQFLPQSHHKDIQRYWRLRTPGATDNTVAYVDYASNDNYAEVQLHGREATIVSGFRPALYINLEP